MMNVYPVTNRDFRLVRSVQNEVIFQIRDIDRKPVSVGLDTLTIAIVDPASNTLLMRRDLHVANPVKGVYQFVTQPSEMDTWPKGPLRWSLTQTGTIGTTMLWTDQNYTPSGILYMTHSPLPGPAATVTISGANLLPGAGP